jgi:hypothetical protein
MYKYVMSSLLHLYNNHHPVYATLQKTRQLTFNNINHTKINRIKLFSFSNLLLNNWQYVFYVDRIPIVKSVKGNNKGNLSLEIVPCSKNICLLG